MQKKIEPNNYLCTGADPFNGNLKVNKLLEEFESKGQIESLRLFSSKCEEEKLGMYNDEYKKLSKKMRQAVMMDGVNSPKYKEYNAQMQNLTSKWKEEAGF